MLFERQIILDSNFQSVAASCPGHPDFHVRKYKQRRTKISSDLKLNPLQILFEKIVSLYFRNLNNLREGQIRPTQKQTYLKHYWE